MRPDNSRRYMASNVIREHCPRCGAIEIDALDTPRTQYECGSSDYDQRPGSFRVGASCVQVNA